MTSSTSHQCHQYSASSYQCTACRVIVRGVNAAMAHEDNPTTNQEG